MSLFARIAHAFGITGYAPNAVAMPVVPPPPAAAPMRDTQCVECGKIIHTRELGNRIHLVCSIEKDKREKEAAKAETARRERIEETKTALREYFEGTFEAEHEADMKLLRSRAPLTGCPTTRVDADMPSVQPPKL